jgi:hypothetical protein
MLSDYFLRGTAGFRAENDSFMSRCKQELSPPVYCHILPSVFPMR